MRRGHSHSGSEAIRMSPVTRTVAITSGKGGVGKTNVVVNLAFALTRLGKKVMVLDADLGLGNIDVLLGLTSRSTLHHVLLGEKRLSEIIIRGPGGMKILPASSGIQELTALTEEQRLLLLSEFDHLEEDVDILLIDTAAGISSNVLYFNIVAQDIIVVVSPEPPSITDAYALMKVLSTKHAERYFKLVVNMAKKEEEARQVFRKLGTVADKFLNISIDYVGSIPYDSNVPKAVMQQKLVSELFPHSEASQAFMDLGEGMCRWPVPSHSKGNIQLFWKRLIVPAR